jgi:hypothetical protein
VAGYVYDNIERITRLSPEFHNLTQSESRSGFTPAPYQSWSNATPVIEVARDRKTTKGFLICPSIVSHPNAESKWTASWTWAKRAFDFLECMKNRRAGITTYKA